VNHGVKLESISPSVFLVEGRNKGRFPYSHSFLITDREVALIDTGCGAQTLTELAKRFDIGVVVNSHTHPDHSAGNWVFKDQPIYVPEEGFATSGNLETLSQRFVSEKLRRFWQRFVSENMGFRNCPPTDRYSADSELNFGRVHLDPLFTPGHTKDHYCFFLKRESTLFSFDYDLTPFPWYGHKESNLEQFKESIQKLKNLSPRVVVSSHRGIIRRDIAAEFERVLRILDARDERILALLQEKKTLDQLVRQAPIYGAFPYAKPLLRYWEGQMIRKHLQHLKTAGRVKSVDARHFQKV
jgi:glyoxylase-like metal-dependent hydrolase (beta-lactamase superfamily II)